MKYSIQLKDKDIVFEGEDISEVDLKDLLVIDYNNLKEEISYFPFILNQINFWLVETKSILNEAKFNLDIINDNINTYKASIYNKIREELIEEGQKTPTITAIENRVLLQSDYKDLKESYNIQNQKVVELQNQNDYISSLYWNAKAKMEILISLSKNVDLSN